MEDLSSVQDLDLRPRSVYDLDLLVSIKRAVVYFSVLLVTTGILDVIKGFAS